MKPRINRRAIIPLSEQLIEGMIKLPEGYVIHGMRANDEMFSIDLYVTSPEFDVVPEGVSPPRIQPTVVQMRDDHYSRMHIIWNSQDEPTPIFKKLWLEWETPADMIWEIPSDLRQV